MEQERSGYVETTPDREKLGKIVYDNMLKPEESLKAVDLQAGMQEEYMDELLNCIDQNYSKFDKEFYIVVLTKAEKILKKVVRNYFFARQSCPTPDFDQSVFKYNKESEKIDFMWTIPSLDACEYLIKHATEIPTNERELLGFVAQFVTGKLLERSKKLNGEVKDSNILLK